MLSIRCSSLPRIALCPASARKPAVRIEMSSEAADLGTAFHTCISQKIKGLPCDIAEVAAENGVDRTELKMLVGIGMAMWARLEKLFPHPIAEHSFECLNFEIVDGDSYLTLTGTGDLLSLSDDGLAIRILDWKSGWGDSDHEEQVKGYALLALREVPTADRVEASVMKVRRGLLDTYAWTRDELESWWETLVGRIVSEDEVYRPSPAACGYCPLFAECPARAKEVRVSLALLQAESELASSSPASPEIAAMIVERARWVAKLAESAINAIKAAVINAGGSIPLPDGRELKINSQVRTEVDFPAGEGVLRAHCGDELGKALNVRKGKSKTDPDKLGIEDIVRAKAPRGQKDAAVEQLLFELDQAAALKLTTVQRLEIVKAPKAVATS